MAWTQHLKIGVDKSAVRLVKRLLMESAAEEWPSYAASFALVGIVSLTTAAMAYLMQDVVNSIFIERNEAAIYFIAGVVLAVFVIKGGASYINALIVARLGQRIVAKLQIRYYESLLRQGLDYFQSTKAGGIMGRQGHNATAARNIINMVAMSLWRDLFSLIALIGVMILQSPEMSLFALLIGPPAVFVVGYLMRRIKEYAKSEVEYIGLTTSILKETIDNVRVIKAYTLEDQQREEMRDAIHRLQERGYAIARLSVLTVPLMEVLGGVAIAGAMVFGGYMVVHNNADPGAFISFVTAFLLAYEPARRLARFNVTFQRQLIGVELFYEMIDQDGSDMERPGAVPLTVDTGEIRFENVDFSYGDAPAVSDLSFTLEAGTMNALVGPSGAGKTTIFSLIERFYSPGSGRILIDGQDIADVTNRSLRGNMAIVTQDPLLFEGTIGENIARGRPGASHEEVIAAATAANAHGFIEELPKGYDTQVGTAGARLSGGQKQRIAIARAILRDAPILLLDEATSALDTLSEVAVQEALARLTKGRTTIAIAHRLSTIFDADKILVLDQGRVVETGTHKELVKTSGLYASLYDQQVSRMAAG